jgi:hypothetical protein
MTNERTITWSQLVAAFTEWEKDRREEPEEFERAFEPFNDGPPRAVAVVQADSVFDYLDKLAVSQ